MSKGNAHKLIAVAAAAIAVAGHSQVNIANRPGSPATVRVAAANSTSADKSAADFICTGTNDEAVLTSAIVTLTRGGSAAAENKPGSWHGYISYTMQGKAFNLRRFWAEGSGIEFRTVNLDHSITSRSKHPEYLETYFDKKTNKTLTWNGKMWVDAMGNPAD